MFRDALKEKREKNQECCCPNTYVFRLWNAKELRPGETVEVIRIHQPRKRWEEMQAVAPGSIPTLDQSRMSDGEWHRMLDGMREKQ